MCLRVKTYSEVVFDFVYNLGNSRKVDVLEYVTTPFSAQMCNYTPLNKHSSKIPVSALSMLDRSHKNCKGKKVGKSGNFLKIRSEAKKSCKKWGKVWYSN